MQINVGNAERVARSVIGLVLLILAFWLETPWRWVGLIGLMPLSTGLAGRCPAYRLWGAVPAACTNRSERPCN